MYQFSRAIYRELAPHLLAPKAGVTANANHEHRPAAPVRRSSSGWPSNASTSRAPSARCSAISAHCFPMSEQGHVHHVVARYIGLAQQFLIENPLAGYASICGEPPQCRATTRKGAACQRVPLPHNGYCPSHQHLADTEDRELAAA